MRSLRIPSAFLRAPFLLLTLGAVFGLTACSSNRNPLLPNPLPTLSQLTLALHTDTLAVGGDVTLVVTAKDTAGADVSPTRLSWSSDDPRVATVGSTGNVHAAGEGVTTIRVAGANLSDSCMIVVYTQPGWYAQTSATVNNLNGVYADVGGRTVWAIGDAGTIIVSRDAGVTWATQVSSSSFKLNGIHFTSATEGWVAGNSGTILHTIDGGATWTRITNVGASENLLAVRFADAAHGWAVGTSGVVVSTRDGGASWTKQHPTASALNSVAFSDTTNGWAVGDNGVIAGTHDGGRSWYIWQPALTSQALHGVVRASNTLAWAVGAQGVTAATTATVDSLTWTLGNAGASYQLFGVAFPTVLVGYAVGQNGSGTVLKTIDGGTTWSAQTANSAQKLNAVWFVDTQRGWAVGDGGRIVHTSRGGL